MQEQALFEPRALPSVSVCAVRDLLSSGWDTLVLPVTEEQAAIAPPDGSSACSLQEPSLAALHSKSGRVLLYAVQANCFAGTEGECLGPLVVNSNGNAGGSVQQVILLGLGSSKDLNTHRWGHNPFHAAGTALARVAKSCKLKHCQVAMHLAFTALQQQHQQQCQAQLNQQQHHKHDQTTSRQAFELSSDQGAPAAAALAVTSLILATLTGLHEGHLRFKTKPEYKAQMHSITVLVPEAQGQDMYNAAVARGTAMAAGNLTARLLVEAPPNTCTPSYMASAAEHLAGANPAHFKLQVLNAEQCKQLGMGLLLGVAQGSAEPLKFIHLLYTPAGPVQQKVALVGKGLTFDSGGYNLKIQGGIETMKCDMAGGAAVLGAATALKDLQPKGIEVHFIIGACENMVGSCATRPGDVHVSAAGKSVEVVDTDAEGRLTLADALWYAQEKAKVKCVVDIATLTGAAGIALGQHTGALFSNTDSMAQAINTASSAAGEKFWRLPLDQGLVKKLESPVADLKNYAGRWGGAITAAMFLQEFIQADCEWCHLDVAGPAWDDAAHLPTGFGVATLVEWLMTRSTAQQ